MVKKYIEMLGDMARDHEVEGAAKDLTEGTGVIYHNPLLKLPLNDHRRIAAIKELNQEIYQYNLHHGAYPSAWKKAQKTLEKLKPKRINLSRFLTSVEEDNDEPGSLLDKILKKK